MQENWFEIIDFFNPAKRFVLATIIATRGATYQKTGTMMLIAESGQCCGLLSGGCLEADISLHAEHVFADNKTKKLTYDLKADAELLWGLGLGCDGAIDILLLPINPENKFLSFEKLLKAVANKEQGYFFQNISDNQEAKANFLNTNALFLTSSKESNTLLPQEGINVGEIESLRSLQLDKQSTNHFISEYLKNGILKADKDSNVNDKEEGLKGTHSGKAELTCLVTPILPPPSILVCGAGPDAAPVINALYTLGWQVEIWDHRETYLQQKAFSVCHQKRKLRAQQSQCDDYTKFDAVVVMSHNLENDSQFVMKALAAKVSYIGVLGPEARRDKILAEHGLVYEQVKKQLYGPIGLNIGGRSPQAIALSIAAEIQQHLTLSKDKKVVKPYIVRCEVMSSSVLHNAIKVNNLSSPEVS